MEQWPLVVADFLSEYGIRLRAEYRTLPWREFKTYVTGLFNTDTRLARHFTPDPDNGPTPAPEENPWPTKDQPL